MEIWKTCVVATLFLIAAYGFFRQAGPPPVESIQPDSDVSGEKVRETQPSSGKAPFKPLTTIHAPEHAKASGQMRESEGSDPIPFYKSPRMDELKREHREFLKDMRQFGAEVEQGMARQRAVEIQFLRERLGLREDEMTRLKSINEEFSLRLEQIQARGGSPDELSKAVNQHMSEIEKLLGSENFEKYAEFKDRQARTLRDIAVERNRGKK